MTLISSYNDKRYKIWVKYMLKIKNLKTKLIFSVIFTAIIIVRKLFSVPCIYMFLFDFPCPGCGMTRAMIAALTPDFKSAFEYHAMFWAMPLLYVHFLYDFNFFKNIWDKIFLGFIACGFIVNYMAKISIFLS